MSTAPAPTGARSRRGTHEPTGRQTKPSDTMRRPTGGVGSACEEPRPAAAHSGALAEAPGYPSLCAHGMNSLTDTGYELARARLRRG